MGEKLRVQLTPEQLKDLTYDELVILLGDLQKSSEVLFTEAWRRNKHTELAAEAMQMKIKGLN